MLEQALILAGGRGTRLGARTAGVPKPLLTVDDRPFLDYLVAEVARHGISDIVILAGFEGAQIAARYDGRQFGGARVSCVIEPAPAGTAGALLAAGDRLAESFLLLNGDTWFDVNYLDLALRRHRAGTAAAVALRPIDAAARFGAVRLDGDRIVDFAEKATTGRALVNGGVYVLGRDVLDLVDRTPCSIEQDVFPRLVQAGALAGMVYDGFFIDIGIPETFEAAQHLVPARQQRPAAFLDRDGTICVDTVYPHKPADIVWIDGAIAAIKELNDRGYFVFVITNQSGVARGYYDEAAVHGLHAWMQRQFRAHGAHVDAFYYCPHHPEGTVAAYRKVCDCRKPADGMIREALAAWQVDTDRSFVIGYKEIDVAAGRQAGMDAYLFDGKDIAGTVLHAISQN